MTVHRLHWCIVLIVATVLLQWGGAATASAWQHPLTKQGRLGSPLVEVSPFVFNDRLYLLENNQKFWDIGGKPGDRFHEDEVRIRDLEADKVVSVALRGYAFATVLVDEGRVYVFAGDYGKDKPWRQITEIVMTRSDDLVNWSKPVVVLRATEQDGYFWNTAVARGPKGYVLLVETSDVRFPPFTFRYLESDDLVTWREIPDALYGRDKYVGGPALYYEGGWWYTLYLQNIGRGWETRITRSTDLVHWEDAPEGRPFVTFNPEHRDIPLLDPSVCENNASDAEVTYFQGRTIVYFTGSDQSTAGDLQWATFEGTPRELFEAFFAGRTSAGNGNELMLAPEQMKWLVDKAHAIHDASIMKLADGTPVYSPMGYGGVWPRDMYYVVAGVPERADMSIVRGVVELCLGHQRPDGTVPKNFSVDAVPGYVCWAVRGGFDAVELPVGEASPIWDGQREMPEADSGQFVVLLAHQYWAQTQDAAFVRKHLAALKRALDGMPRDESGLIWIDPAFPHTTYGFTDNVGKTGNELFCSLLYWEASQKLAEMARAAGEDAVARDFEKRAELIEQNIDRLKDPETGLYFAATGVGRQIDIWGNAYLVYIDFPDAARRTRISHYLAENHESFVSWGQVRHLRKGEYWQKTFRWPTGGEYTRGEFQNGAYWGTATGWVAYAIGQVDRPAAAKILRDMIASYQQHGVWEYMYEDGRTGPMADYAASVVNPLAALRRLDEQTTYPVTTTTDTVAPEHAGDWAPVLIAPRAGTAPRANAATMPIRHVPTPQQLAYQNAQLGAFVHFGPATYINSDMLSTPDASVFNPVRLDAEQWVLAAKSVGASHIVLTAKHHNGFCLWPTKTTSYSVKNSPWKNGRGDVVRELADACRKHNMKLGLYVSGGDKHYGCHSTPDPMGERKIVGDRDAYFLVFMEQLKELLTGYGEISVVWFDGAYDPFGWDVSDASGKPLGTAHGDAIAAFVRALQPNAVIFGGTQPDVRWSGSEQGWSPYPLWNVVRPGEGPQNWVSPTNVGWILAEANIHTRDTWFWVPNSDHTLRSVDFLMQAYYNSIGRGGNLLVNLAPDTTGRIPEAEMKRLAEFGEALKRRFGASLATTDSLKGWTEAGVLVLKLPRASRVDHVVIEEDIAQGQHIRAYAIDALVNGQWQQIAAGESIGRRRIEKLTPVTTQQVRLRITQANAMPAIRTMSAYRSGQ